MKAEKTNGKAIPRQVKTTTGNIEEFNRDTWNYMKKHLNLTESQIFPMKGASYPAKVNGMPANLVRYFDPDTAKEKGLTINDYVSLNDHPELILYEGYRVRGRGGEINIQKGEDGASLLQEKITKGDITEVGVINEEPASNKWLRRFGNFMMMGGFLVVLLVVVALVIGISIAAQSC